MGLFDEFARRYNELPPSVATQVLNNVDNKGIKPIIGKLKASERQALAKGSVLYSSLPPNELADFLEKRSGKKILP